MEKEQLYKRRNKFFLVGLSIIIVLILILIYIRKDRIELGYALFGNSTCLCDVNEVRMAGMAFADWNCEICGVKGTNNTTNVPRLCDGCGSIANRCRQCGKLYK